MAEVNAIISRCHNPERIMSDLVFELKQCQPVCLIITANYRRDWEATAQEKDKGKHARKRRWWSWTPVGKPHIQYGMLKQNREALISLLSAHKEKHIYIRIVDDWSRMNFLHVVRTQPKRQEGEDFGKL